MLAGRYLPCTVIMMIWTYKYERDEVIEVFETEQDFVDFMFRLIIMRNFGVWVDTDKMRVGDD